ncbi:MAG: hypothetical protein EXS67_01010 [Candidatus Margulisbacteria bacterium]|nr:hypothetical protein [Candidatus Margulisiibacteriota bacterium]
MPDTTRSESRGYADNSRPGSPGYRLGSPTSTNGFIPIANDEPTFESPHVQNYYTEIATVLDPKTATILASALESLGTTGHLTKDISNIT